MAFFDKFLVIFKSYFYSGKRFVILLENQEIGNFADVFCCIIYSKYKFTFFQFPVFMRCSEGMFTYNYSATVYLVHKRLHLNQIQRPDALWEVFMVRKVVKLDSPQCSSRKM